MNIHLSNSTHIFAGGEDYVFILAKHLHERGHCVSVSANPGHLLLKKCQESQIGTVPLVYRGRLRLFRAAAALRKELRERSVDIVHSNANYDRTCAAIAVARTPVRHVASVHSAHSIQHNATHWLRNRFGIDHFIADADIVKEVLATEDGIPAAKITVIPLGVDSDSDEFRRNARAKTRAELHVSPSTVVVGNVARLVPFKGQQHLLEAAAEVARTYRDVLFIIIGEGELKDSLTHHAARLGITQYVRLLGFRNNLHELYPAFDIYCHTSLEMASEAFPLAVLRALSAGLPVICSEVGGIGAMVDDGITGYLTRPKDERALADALKRLIADTALRCSMGKAAIDLFLRKFQASTMADSVERVYTSLVPKQRGQG